MYPRQPGIKILQYTFDVTVGDATYEMTIKDTIDLQFLSDGIEGIDLDLCNLIGQPQAPNRLNACLQSVPRTRGNQATTSPSAATPTSVGRGMTVTEVTSNGAPLMFEHKNNRLHVRFPGSHMGEKLSFTISYHGVPANGIFIGKNKYGDRVWFTDNWPNKARNWLATIDHVSVKAPKTIAVTAPQSYQVISNGQKTEETNLTNGLRRTTWTESKPIPSWQYNLGIAAMAVEYFGRFHGTEFSAWVFPQNRDAGFKALDRQTASIFEFYSDHIGPFAYEKLAQVEATGGGGATEPATAIFYYSGFGAAAHEIAHHWFGDAVTERDWDDVWLSEGFATYFNLLYIEHQEGHDAFLAGVERTRNAAMAYVLAHPDDTIVHKNLSNDSNVFSNSAQIYQEGAMVLQMLRGVLGDEVFWSGIRLYYSRYMNGSASSDDLRHAMEDACYAAGNCSKEHQDLSWFFQEWLNRGGIIKADGGWHYDAAAKVLHIELNQTQAQGLYRMPVEVAIKMPSVSESGPEGGRGRVAAEPEVKKVTVLLEKQQNSLTVPLDTAPTDVALDPSVWVPMMQASFVAK
jgi:aminopeptidase N